MFTWQNLIIIFLFVALSVGLLSGIRVFVNQWLKWDIGEKERILQTKLNDLTVQCDQYKAEVSDLRKQVRILLSQYDEAVVKLNKLDTLYEAAKKDADSLRNELDRMQTDIQDPPEHIISNRILIVAIGSNKPNLNLDMASIRGVSSETSIMVQRIGDATPDKLKVAIDKARRRRAVIYLHLAIDSDENGYQLGDTIVDADWLSANLGGVIILVVAGSESSDIGEFISTVPYVITMSDKVVSRDVAFFSREFWTEVGRGYGADLALTKALSRSPSVMKEYVAGHWVFENGR